MSVFLIFFTFDLVTMVGGSVLWLLFFIHQFYILVLVL